MWDRDERLALRTRELPPELLTATRVLHVDDVDQTAAIAAARKRPRTDAIVLLCISSPRILFDDTRTVNDLLHYDKSGPARGLLQGRNAIVASCFADA